MRKCGIVILLLICSAMLFGTEKIMLYTSVPTEIMTAIADAFMAANPDIELEVFRSGTGTIQTKLAAEAQTGNVQADVLWVAEFSYYETLKKEGLLAQIYPEEAASLPENFKDPDGYYYAGRLINMVIAYNTKALTPETAPRSWKELTDEKWYDNFVVPNPEYSGAAVAAVGALAKKYGWEYFKDLRENEAVVVRGNSDVAQKVAAGEFPIGMTLDYIARDLNVKGSPIDIIYPTDGTIAIPSPIAILKSSQKMEAAMKFVNYILSIEGQKALVELGSLVPVRSDVNPPANTPPAGEILDQAMEIDWKYIEEGLTEINTNFSDIMLF
ncbi:ABC transporter substrate-binding protein [Mesotoga sp. H07.pep.5.3]|uniref:ABC transporter substrate-binding protein n=1 Tax=Mesotoga sp. H07.pep.5.3 TaxID=1421003 RepID=UPI000C1A3906|nr:ABC transporter substrate-binding protein [Mesotoga sp. H07.pep.5.3]